jgi:VanZ family protein
LNWAWILSALLACYWLALFIGTHYPKPPRLAGAHTDKVLHSCAFGGLAVLLCAVRRMRCRLPLRFYVGLLLLLAAYGCADELSQTLVGRDCTVGDWLADMAGAALACVSFAIATRSRSTAKPINPAPVVLRLPRLDAESRSRPVERSA